MAQFPNPPLWIAFAALLVGLLSAEGSDVNDLARAVAYVALTVWAYEEAANGVNAWRRLLGSVAVIVIVIALAIA